MDDALEFANGSVTSSLLRKLSGDSELIKKNSKVIEKPLPDDDIVIILKKLRKRRIKGKEM